MCRRSSARCCTNSACCRSTSSHRSAYSVNDARSTGTPPVVGCGLRDGGHPTTTEVRVQTRRPRWPHQDGDDPRWYSRRLPGGGPRPNQLSPPYPRRYSAEALLLSALLSVTLVLAQPKLAEHPIGIGARILCRRRRTEPGRVWGVAAHGRGENRRPLVLDRVGRYGKWPDEPK